MHCGTAPTRRVHSLCFHDIGVKHNDITYFFGQIPEKNEDPTIYNCQDVIAMASTLKCRGAACQNTPTLGSNGFLYCVACTAQLKIPHVYQLCVVESCPNMPIYGDATSTRYTHCAQHATNEVKKVRRVACYVPNCSEPPVWHVLHNGGKACEKHRTQNSTTQYCRMIGCVQKTSNSSSLLCSLHGEVDIVKYLFSENQRCLDSFRLYLYSLLELCIHYGEVTAALIRPVKEEIRNWMQSTGKKFVDVHKLDRSYIDIFIRWSLVHFTRCACIAPYSGLRYHDEREFAIGIMHTVTPPHVTYTANLAMQQYFTLQGLTKSRRFARIEEFIKKMSPVDAYLNGDRNAHGLSVFKPFSSTPPCSKKDFVTIASQTDIVDVFQEELHQITMLAASDGEMVEDYDAFFRSEEFKRDHEHIHSLIQRYFAATMYDVVTFCFEQRNGAFKNALQKYFDMHLFLLFKHQLNICIPKTYTPFSRPFPCQVRNCTNLASEYIDLMGYPQLCTEHSRDSTKRVQYRCLVVNCPYIAMYACNFDGPAYCEKHGAKLIQKDHMCLVGDCHRPSLYGKLTCYRHKLSQITPERYQTYIKLCRTAILEEVTYYALICKYMYSSGIGKPPSILKSLIDRVPVVPQFKKISHHVLHQMEWCIANLLTYLPKSEFPTSTERIYLSSPEELMHLARPLGGFDIRKNRANVG